MYEMIAKPDDPHSNRLIFLVELALGFAVATQFARIDVVTMDEARLVGEGLANRHYMRNTERLEHPTV